MEDASVVPRQKRPPPFPNALLAAAAAAAAAVTTNDLQSASPTATSTASTSSNHADLSISLLSSIVTLTTQLSTVAHVAHPQPPPSDITPSTSTESLQWLRASLQRVYDQLATPTRPSPTAPFPRLLIASPSSSRAALRSRNHQSTRTANSEDVDGLEGVEDRQVDSEDDMPDDLSISRRSSAKRVRYPPTNPHSRSQHNVQNIHSPNNDSTATSSQPQSTAAPPGAIPSRNSARGLSFPKLPHLPLDDDTPVFSTQSSQAHIDHSSKPHFKLPIGSPANSYLTQMSSFKSLGQGEANRLHRDYTKIFKDSDDGPSTHPGESSIEIAGGDLYTSQPLNERWSLGHKIGEGGYATVRVASRKSKLRRSQLPTHTISAVKIISKKSPDLYNEKMVSREVFSFRLLDMAGGHDNIVELYEVSEDDENVYLVMEYLEGGELFARISERGQYTERDAANLVVSMLASLAFCHRLNLTHRDVKPENFVFASDESEGADVKLTDFGIAYYSEDPSALCKTLCGTPLYVAPEVLLRQPYGAEADLWSLGVIVYIMLVGYPPFDDNDLVQLVKKIKYGPVKFDGAEWMLISEEGKQFLANLLDKDASNRMTAQQALEHDWLRNKCQAATDNVLQEAQTNIKSFVSRKRWKAAIQSVKAMNRIYRMVELSRQGNSVDGFDGISAEKVEVVHVQRVDEEVDHQQHDHAVFTSSRPLSFSSSSSSEQAFSNVRRPAPVRTHTMDRERIETASFGLDEGEEGVGATFGSGIRGLGAATSSATTATINSVRSTVKSLRSTGSAASAANSPSQRSARRALGRVSLSRRRRVSSSVTGDAASGTMAAVDSGNAANAVLLAIDPAFESSDDSRSKLVDRGGSVDRLPRRRRYVRLSRERFSGLRGNSANSRNGSSGDGRVGGGALASVGAGVPGGVGVRARVSVGALVDGRAGYDYGNGDPERGRVSRTLTRREGGGVVRKMSSHAKKLVGKSRRNNHIGGVVSEDRAVRPVMMEMGEHRKKRFSWFPFGEQ